MKRFLILLSPAVVLVAAIVRVLLVSNYQVSTAVAVAAAAGPLSTLIGTLLPIVQVFLPVLTAILFLLLFNKSLDRRQVIILAFLALLATLLVTPTTVTWTEVGDIGSSLFGFVFTHLPWLLYAILFLFVACAIVWVAVSITEKEFDFNLLSLGGVLSVFVTAIVIFAVVCLCILLTWAAMFPSVVPEAARLPERARSMWIPAEEVRGGSNELIGVGYVLDQGNGWMTLLTESDRTIIMVRSDAVYSRKICHLDAPNGMPLLPLPGATIPDIPTCAGYIKRTVEEITFKDLLDDHVWPLMDSGMIRPESQGK